VLTDSMLHQLESFQGEMWSSHTETVEISLYTFYSLGSPVTARIFVCKLSLLSKVSDEGNNIGSQIFSSLPQVFAQARTGMSSYALLPMPCSVPSQL
jgi:hypothetical protein